MSYFEAEEAPCSGRNSSIALRVEPRAADLGEFTVRRALPAALLRRRYPALAPRSPFEGQGTTYTVAGGESLFDIARFQPTLGPHHGLHSALQHLAAAGREHT